MGNRLRRPWLLAAVLGLLAAACANTSALEAQRVQRADVQVLPGGGSVNPLTGIATGAQEWRNRPVVAIKVGNSSPERPQAGLDKADLIFEELVEGDVTRFMALFSTNSVARVGPVRSVRSVDPDLLAPIGGLLSGSGGVPPVINKLRSTPGLSDVGAKSLAAPYRRDGSRRAPYNLYTSTDALLEGRSGSPPGSPIFSFLSTADDPTTGGQETANKVSFSFAGSSTQIGYDFDNETGKYKRNVNGSAHNVEGVNGPQQLVFRNILVQMVNVTTGSTRDQSGASSREIQVTGSGSAVLFRGGKALRGSWQRSSVGEATKFIDGSGQPLRLAPGESIVELLPSSRADTLFVS